MANLEVAPSSERFFCDTDLICPISSWFNVFTSKVDSKSNCYEYMYLIVDYERKEKDGLYIRLSLSFVIYYMQMLI